MGRMYSEANKNVDKPVAVKVQTTLCGAVKIVSHGDCIYLILSRNATGISIENIAQRLKAAFAGNWYPSP